MGLKPPEQGQWGGGGDGTSGFVSGWSRIFRKMRTKKAIPVPPISISEGADASLETSDHDRGCGLLVHLGGFLHTHRSALSIHAGFGVSLVPGLNQDQLHVTSGSPKSSHLPPDISALVTHLFGSVSIKTLTLVNCLKALWSKVERWDQMHGCGHKSLLRLCA